jgi:hypothetical protein
VTLNFLLQKSLGIEHDMNITHSEYEEGSEEKKEEEEEESEDEEEVNEVDLAVQTSVMDFSIPQQLQRSKIVKHKLFPEQPEHELHHHPYLTHLPHHAPVPHVSQGNPHQT